MCERELFVWYRVKREHADTARAAVVAMQRSLGAKFPGLTARLLERDDGASSTWMETYARPGAAARAGTDADVEAAIAAAAHSLASLIDGERHVEAFAVAERR